MVAFGLMVMLIGVLFALARGPMARYQVRVRSRMAKSVGMLALINLIGGVLIAAVGATIAISALLKL